MAPEVPPSGFRHAFDLLVTNGARKLRFDASQDALSEGVVQLAAGVVQLSKDMRASPGWRDWIIVEFDRLLESRIPDAVLARVRSQAHALLGSIGSEPAPARPCDVFVAYVPEDRLPLAAPLAVELSKRGARVGFADFEFEDVEQLKAAVGRGLSAGAPGVLILSPNFDRRIDRSAFFPPDRLLIVDDFGDRLMQTAERVYRWTTLQRDANEL